MEGLWRERLALPQLQAALGNETDLSYNLANQNTGVSFAATGSTGTGHATFANTYLYVGGPKTEET